ncbi:hypothetical protein, partial [Sphingomonas pseudosanguinis]|uniref:hypothetical protein n=1 Tax=Sphingomonas pseudosanguinis TaxID=413712 RepID=UPI0019D27707
MDHPPFRLSEVEAQGNHSPQQPRRNLPADTSAKDRLWSTARAANQLRQSGDFKDAEAMRQAAMAVIGQSGT